MASQKVDFLIIGGGIIGTSIAWELAKKKAGKVLLLEKRHLAAGSSGKSGAILRQHYSHETTIKMARDSLVVYRDFQKNTGHDIGFKEIGMIFIGDESSRGALEYNVNLQKSLGVNTELLDHEGLKKIEPRADFAPGTWGAWEPNAGYVNPVATVVAIVAQAEKLGADIRKNAQVTKLLKVEDRVTGVELSGGEKIEAKQIILATGPWSQSLLKQHGIDSELKAIRPEQAYFEPPVEFGERPYIFGDLFTGVYFKPENAGWTRVGKLSYDGDHHVPDPDHYDEGVSQEFIQFCRERISKRYPDYQRSVSWGGCSALYTVTPDAHPVIGEVPGFSGLTVVSGFSGHGFKMGPSVGLGLAGMLTETDTGAMDPGFFAYDRFIKNQPIKAGHDEYGILG